jgi:hypothetical protein
MREVVDHRKKGKKDNLMQTALLNNIPEETYL